MIQTPAVHNRSTWLKIRQQKDGLSKDTDKKALSWCQAIYVFLFFWHTETRWVVLVNIFFLFFRQVATEKTFSVSSAWFQSKPEECWKDNATTTTTKKVATFNVKDLTVFRTKIKAHLWFIGWLRYDKILHVSKSEAGETTTTCYCVLPPGWRCMSWYVTRCHPRTGTLYCGGFSKSPQLLRTCHHNRKTQNRFINPITPDAVEWRRDEQERGHGLARVHWILRRTKGPM